MKLTALLLFVLISVSAFTQGFNNETSGFTLSMEYFKTGQVENIIDTLYMDHCVIDMTNANNINKVLFVLKDLQSNENLYGAQILLNGENTLPAGLTTQKNGNEFRVIVGAFSPTRRLQFTVLLEDINGNVSSPKVIE